MKKNETNKGHLRIKAIFTTDIIKGQSEYYLMEKMHNIHKITVNGKKIGHEIVFKIPEVPNRNRKNAIKIYVY